MLRSYMSLHTIDLGLAMDDFETRERSGATSSTLLGSLLAASHIISVKSQSDIRVMEEEISRYSFHFDDDEHQIPHLQLPNHSIVYFQSVSRLCL